jgi:hypothetical protein
MNRRGITQFHEISYIVGGQVDGAAGPAMLYPQPAVSINIQDGPTVAVFHPIGGRCAEPAIIPTGDDQLAGTSPVSIRQPDLQSRRGRRVQAVGASPLVELGDQVTRGGKHDRIQATAAVGLPGVEDVLGECS